MTAARRGRPCLAPSERKVRVGALIDPKVYDRFVAVAKCKGLTHTQAIEKAIEQWAYKGVTDDEWAAYLLAEIA